MVLGHEFVGEVVAPGPERCADSASGRSSPAAPVSLVDECDRCREGRTNLCRRTTRSVSTPPAAWPSTSPCRESTLVPVPDGLSLDAAGLAQPLAVGLHAARRSGAPTATGSCSSAPARSARSCSPDCATSPTSTSRSSTSRVRGWSGQPGSARPARRPGRRGSVEPGADVVIEASGAPGQLDAAIALVRPGGTVLQVGHPSPRRRRWTCTRWCSTRSPSAPPSPTSAREDLAPALELLATTSLVTELLAGVYRARCARRAARPAGVRASWRARFSSTRAWRDEMKAAVFHGEHDVRVEEVTDPTRARRR